MTLSLQIKAEMSRILGESNIIRRMVEKLRSLTPKLLLHGSQKSSLKSVKAVALCLERALQREPAKKNGRYWVGLVHCFQQNCMPMNANGLF